MAGDSLGVLFRVTTFGESHGTALGAVIEGVPAGLSLSQEDLQKELDRRRPGQSKMTTARRESDTVEILSGVFEGRATGTPLALLIRNSDQHSGDYADIRDIFRPGHADYTFFQKFGIRDYRGGGRSSGRETVARVAAGAVAKKILERYGVSITAYTKQIGKVVAGKFDPDWIEKNPVRCGDPDVSDAMIQEVAQAALDGDSVGGMVECRIAGMPAGAGEGVFDKLDAELAKAFFSIGGVKGVEIGAGFAVCSRRGSENNDFMNEFGFVTNRAGGVLGGISTGAELVIRVAVKPTPSISRPQKTVNLNGEAVSCQIHGRHDPCLCPRIVPVVESMAAMVLVDLLFRMENRNWCEISK